jgi:hypothetical protein
MSGAFLLGRGPGDFDIPVAVSEDGALKVVEGLSIPEWDYASLGWTNHNLTSVIYKSGGSSGEVVATVSLAYDASDHLTSISKS